MVILKDLFCFGVYYVFCWLAVKNCFVLFSIIVLHVLVSCSVVSKNQDIVTVHCVAASMKCAQLIQFTLFALAMAPFGPTKTMKAC